MPKDEQKTGPGQMNNQVKAMQKEYGNVFKDRLGKKFTFTLNNNSKINGTLKAFYFGFIEVDVNNNKTFIGINHIVFFEER